MADDFIVVKSKKRTRRKQYERKVQNGMQSWEIKSELKCFDIDQVKAKLNTCVEHLKKSEFYIEVLGEIKPLCDHMLLVEAVNNTKQDDNISMTTENMATLSLSEEDSRRERDGCKGHSNSSQLEFVCYGVGSIASCVTARYQLALCLALREDLKLGPISVYDPVFTGGEKLLLKELNFHVISVNEEGKRPCSSPTLFFLPHCGKALYNNLLWSNWSHQQLQHIIILGNSFSAMVDRTPARLLRETGSYIMKIQEFTEEIPLKCNFSSGDVFNDISIHHFPPHKLKSVPSEVWDSRTEPDYRETDAEIIMG